VRCPGPGLSALSAALLLLDAERDLVADELAILNAKRPDPVGVPNETDSESDAPAKPKPSSKPPSRRVSVDDPSSPAGAGSTHEAPADDLAGSSSASAAAGGDAGDLLALLGGGGGSGSAAGSSTDAAGLDLDIFSAAAPADVAVEPAAAVLAGVEADVAEDPTLPVRGSPVEEKQVEEEEEAPAPEPVMSAEEVAAKRRCVLCVCVCVREREREREKAAAAAAAAPPIRFFLCHFQTQALC
jgi:hypothetical protein